jgi:curved DNA-binding protein CbpA
VTNAYHLLSLEPALVISEEELRDAWREAGKQAHPDAGGSEDGFAELRDAFARLSSPSRRLMHWLELRGTPGDVRGSIGSGLMDLFSEVGTVSNRAEEIIRRREAAKSSLGRAMLEGETQLCREAVELAIARVEAEIATEAEAFPFYQAAESPDVEAVSMTARNLAFLEKWRAGLRSCYARLV